MTKKQHYMTPNERQKLEALREEGIPVSRIAQRLGFCRQTIYNELKRGQYQCVKLRHGYYYDEVHYSADKAQQIHDYRQTAKGRPLKIGHDRAYAEFLEEKMLGIQEHGTVDRRKRCSPAVALELAKREGHETAVCVSTLYSYISKGVFLTLTNKDLWEKSKKKKRSYEQVRRIAHPLLPSITERPKYINSREEPGHCEMDLVVSCSKGKGGVLTITERSGRFEIIRKIPNKKAETIRAALLDIKRRLPPGMEIKSITTDNGSEFLQYEALRAAVACPIYYCHSYAAWEKGSNENHNRMIRRWYPKGTDFSKVSKKDIAECEAWMNNYPRKSLGWLTPMEFMRRWTA